MSKEVASALRDSLVSTDRDDANLVDAIVKVARALTWIAFGDDGNKSPAELLGEDIMEAARTIATAISELADAVRPPDASGVGVDFDDEGGLVPPAAP